MILSVKFKFQHDIYILFSWEQYLKIFNVFFSSFVSKFFSWSEYTYTLHCESSMKKPSIEYWVIELPHNIKKSALKILSHIFKFIFFIFAKKNLYIFFSRIIDFRLFFFNKIISIFLLLLNVFAIFYFVTIPERFD